ncbi:hypothetical protein EVAR_31230_1 [Eumeta japonica]|uniref:Uncharacterized protein n=1 Tax=Eumeta variegata TaxID=151549 RepID=A0A4C1W2I2_EUMVA|nr:hypothetical protein EVAR_31230_1 [Eumeta japonica]
MLTTNTTTDSIPRLGGCKDFRALAEEIRCRSANPIAVPYRRLHSNQAEEVLLWQSHTVLTGEVLHSHRIQTYKVAASAIAFRPGKESSGGPLPLPPIGLTTLN